MSKPDHVVWVDVLSYLRAQRPLMCRQWFDEIEPVGVVDAVYLARVVQPVRQKYLQKECAEAFNEALQAATGNLLTVRFLGPEDPPAETMPVAAQPAIANGAASTHQRDSGSAIRTHTPARRSIQHTPPSRHDGLIISPDNTFENFIVGPENRMAHAAALSVAANPGGSYNPLFIHGGVGLGKTHLLQSICLQIMAGSPDAAICYVSCEEFMTQFMDAVQAGQMAEFRHRFRDVDVLVIDDIHFLAKRDRTQEEFFHTFNALYQAGKQIVLSSDAPPTEIPDLEARLVSRFQSGLVVDIAPPCFETRVQIVKQKARIRGIEFDEPVACFVAQCGVNNIRELEGAIAKVQMLSSADKRPIDLALAQSALGQSEHAVRPQTTINTIIDAVVSFYNVKLTDLQSKRRQKSIAHPRQVCMYLARKFTRFSLEEIGGHFGGRDHTTVMHAERVVAQRRKADGEFDAVLERLEDRIRLANGSMPVVVVRPTAPSRAAV
jgi:chromosomal replication initiator protein